MKVALVSPTTWQLVEKMAALFSEGIEVIGPLSDDKHYWNDYSRKMNEWQELGLKVSLKIKPYEDIDFSQYDILVESAETFFYSKDWVNHCTRIECPVLLKVCWTRDPSRILPLDYVKKLRNYPVLVEMPSHAAFWKSAGFKDVNIVFNPVGDWWFSKEWTGEKEQILFVLSGAKSWRPKDPSLLGLDMWDRLARVFSGKTYHHDGHESYKTSKEMCKLFSESRVFINLDRPFGQGERPLTLAFEEALSAGLPVVARDYRGLNYKDFIDSNGMCTNDFEVMCSFIRKCLTDIDFARQCSKRSREIGYRMFSCETLRPTYSQIIERTQKIFQSNK